MKGKVYFSDLNFPLMRISIVSTKGGVGKSTIAISLSRELADRCKRVLLVDMDLSGFSSLIAGIREQGLISSTVDGNDSNYLGKYTLAMERSQYSNFAVMDLD